MAVAISMWAAKSASQWLRDKYRTWSHSTTYALNKLQAVELTARDLHDKKLKFYRDMDRLTQPEAGFTM